jgi:hypothetical protein
MVPVMLRVLRNRVGTLFVVGVLLTAAAAGHAAPPRGAPLRIEGHFTLDGYNSYPVVLEWDDGGGGYYDPTIQLHLIETAPGYFDTGFGGVADWTVNRYGPYYNGAGTFYPGRFDYGIGGDNDQLSFEFVMAGFLSGIGLMMVYHVVGEIMPAVRQLLRL